MDDSEPKPERFHTLVAVLIALVAVVGAITSWRVAVASDEAGSADSAALRALTDKEDATTRAKVVLMKHLNAYAAYLKNDALAKAYDVLARANAERTDLSHYASAFRYAANQAQDAIPQSYIDREGRLDRKRDLGAQIAQDSRNKDVEPQPHFARADAYRQKARWLLAAIFFLSLAALLLTTADAIRNPLRYLFLIGGVGIFAIAVMLGWFVEIASALGWLWR